MTQDEKETLKQTFEKEGFNPELGMDIVEYINHPFFKASLKSEA